VCGRREEGLPRLRSDAGMQAPAWGRVARRGGAAGKQASRGQGQRLRLRGTHGARREGPAGMAGWELGAGSDVLGVRDRGLAAVRPGPRAAVVSNSGNCAEHRLFSGD